MKTWRVLGHYNAETQAYTEVDGTFASGKYQPDFAGRLVGIRLLEGHEAATSLMCDVEIRLSCTAWKPNVMELAINGGGLKTVPVAHLSQVDYEVDQPIQSGVGITVEGRHATATGVTTSVLVLGCFEVN